jgi:hypothetical protein
VTLVFLQGEWGYVLLSAQESPERYWFRNPDDEGLRNEPHRTRSEVEQFKRLGITVIIWPKGGVPLGL